MFYFVAYREDSLDLYIRFVAQRVLCKLLFLAAIP